ncbi:MAG: hypothetical protein ACR2NO_11560 [Chloroflexota bacterium]
MDSLRPRLSEAVVPPLGTATHELLRALVDATKARLSLTEHLSGPADLADWQARLRAALWEVLGVVPEAAEALEEVPVIAGESVVCDGYVRHHVYYAGALGAADTTGWLSTPPANMKLSLEQMKHAGTLSFHVNWSQWYTEITNQLLPTFRGEMSVKEACDKATQIGDTLLRGA